MKPSKQPLGYDGRFELSFKIVPDPYEPGAEITAPYNIRHDIVESLYARRGNDGRRWLDEAQRRAGNRFLGLLEAAQRQSSLSCDPTREPVDSCTRAWEFTDKQSSAWRELRRVAEQIGRDDYVFLARIIGLGMPLHDLDSRTNGHRRKLTALRFRRILTVLAIGWGFQSNRLQPIDGSQPRA